MTNSLSLFSSHKSPLFLAVTLQPQGKRINSKQLSIELSSRNLGKLFQADPHEIHGLRDVIEWLANWFCERFNKRPLECRQALQQLHALVNPQVIDLYRSQSQDGFTYVQALAPFRRIYELLPDEDMKQTFLKSVQLRVSAAGEETIGFIGCPFVIKLKPGQQRPEGLVPMQGSAPDAYPQCYTFPHFESSKFRDDIMLHLSEGREEAAARALAACAPEDLFNSYAPPPPYYHFSIHEPLWYRAWEARYPDFAEKIVDRMLLAGNGLYLGDRELVQAISTNRKSLITKILGMSSLEVIQALHLNNSTALMVAIGTQEPGLARLIFNKIIELSEQAGKPPVFTARTEEENCTEFFLAMLQKDWELATKLIEYSSLEALMAISSKDYTALMFSMVKSKLDLTKAIIDRILKLSAEANTRPIFTAQCKEWSELTLAICNQDWELAKVLAKYSSLEIVTASYGKKGPKVWMQAIKEGQFDLAQLIINRIRELNPQATFTLAPRQNSKNCWRIPSLTGAQPTLPLR